MAWGLRLPRRKSGAAKQPEPTAAEPTAVETAGSDGQAAPKPAAAEARVGVPPVQSLSANLHTLRQKLLDVYAQRIPREQFAEQAVQLIAKTLGANAAALLAYEQRRDRLSMVAAVGLEPQACQALGGEGGLPGWDIPMRGLANRRISVIESAHQNPFVPKPLIEVSPKRLTIVTVPFFHGYAPSGVVVLLSNKPRGFTDVQLQALGQALKVCALAFAELPRATTSAPAGRASARVVEEAPAPSDVVGDRQRAADAQELARLRTAFDEALWQHAKELAEARRAAAEALDAERVRTSSVESMLANLQEERDRVAAQLSAARGELATLADTREALATHTREVDRLQENLAQARAEIERTSNSLAELRRAHAELTTEHEAKLRQQAQQDLTADAERKQSATVIEELRARAATLENERAQLRATVEEIRGTHESVLAQLDAMTARASTLEEKLAKTSTAREALGAQQIELRAAYEAMADRTRAAEEAVAKLQQELAKQSGVVMRERETLAAERARVDEITGKLAQTAAERDASAGAATETAARLAMLEQELTQSTAEHAAALAAIQEERDRLVAELNIWREREPAWGGEIERATKRAEAAEAEKARLAASLTRLESERERSVDQIGEHVRSLEAAADRLGREHSELEARHVKLEAAKAALQDEHEQLGALCDALRAEQRKISAERDDTVASREQEIAALRKQLDDALARHESDVGEKSSHAKRLASERDAAEAALRAAEANVKAQAQQLKELEARLAADAAMRGEIEQSSLRHAQDADELRQELAHARASLEELRRERDAAAEDINAAVQRDVEKLRAQIDAARNEVASRDGLLGERERELATLQAELAEIRAVAEHDRAAHGEEIERVSREWEQERAAQHVRTEQLEGELDRVRREHFALAQALAADESQPGLEIERCVIPGSDGDGAAEELSEDLDIERVEPVELVPETIAVFDGEFGTAMVAAASAVGWEAIACEPTEAAIDALRAHRPSVVAVNILSGDGWQLVRRLRAERMTRTTPILLYAKQDEDSGFCFGTADCVPWPAEPQRLLDTVARLAPRAKRVLALSTDIDVVATVREQLTGAGLSAAVMLDGKQALDLLPSVRPDAVVLHLSSICTGVFRTLSGLRPDGFAGLPMVLLMDREPTSRDSTFLVGGARTLAKKGSFGAAQLADVLTQVASQAGGDEVEEPSRRLPAAPSVGQPDGWVG